MIAGIADIIILALVIGYCGYIIYRKHQDKAAAPVPARAAALPSIRKRNKQPNENSPIVQERR